MLPLPTYTYTHAYIYIDAANCPLNSDYKIESVVYKSTVEYEKGQEKVDIRSTKRTFKKRCYNCRASFKLAKYKSNTKLASHVWELKEKLQY